MRLNRLSIMSTNAPLVIKDQQINIVNDFKCIGSYVGSTERNVKVRIRLAWAAFKKLKSILKPSKAKLYFKIGIKQSRDHVKNKSFYQLTCQERWR